jgi:SPP1 family predicted phage head-tail adaptor
MVIGRLRTQISLQSYTESANALGERVKTYTTYATVWARVEPLKGTETVYAQGWASQPQYQITIRYNSDVDVGDRIVLPDNSYVNILSVQDVDYKHEQMVIIA